MNDFYRTLRFDLPSIHLPQDTLINSNKLMGRFRHIGEMNAKPDACMLCGEKGHSFCNSHSIPQFCLKEIADAGKLETLNSSIGIDLLRDKVGINNAGTFKMICRKCDNTYFSDYENPDLYDADSPIKNDLLGKMAVKVCLLEQYKARMQIAQLNAVYNEFGDDARISNMDDVRRLDQMDNDRQLNYACLAVRGEGKGYKVLFEACLDYTTPIAFQGQVVLVADFDGRMINDTFNYSPRYHIEPLYLCVFPLRRGTRVLVFCREVGYARYARFHRRLRSKRRNEALLSILKIMIGCSEEIYLSPLLPDFVFTDDGFLTLARLSNMRFSPFGEMLTKQRKRLCVEYGLDFLPDPPNLLRGDFSMASLRKNQWG